MLCLIKDFKTSKCAMSNVCNFGSAFPLISNLSKYPLPSSDYLLILCNSLEMEKSQLTIELPKGTNPRPGTVPRGRASSIGCGLTLIPQSDFSSTFWWSGWGNRWWWQWWLVTWETDCYGDTALDNWFLILDGAVLGGGGGCWGMALTNCLGQFLCRIFFSGLLLLDILSYLFFVSDCCC